MRISAISATAVALAIAPAANAHDFWLQPEMFVAPTGSPVAVFFNIGHAGAHEPWDLRTEKVAAFTACNAVNCAPPPAVIPNSPNHRGRALVTFETAGTHILAFESRSSFSELDGAAFANYAEKEGLTAILEDRAARKAGDDPGRETYSRRAKALIHVGGGDPGDVSFAVGHRLEIVPLKNPYALKVGEALPVRVVFEGAPLSGTTIDFDDLSDALEPLQSAMTDENGVAAFNVEGPGPFKLMTIWGVPLTSRRIADYETIFASLTFGS